jgi:hypothetical protein
MAKAARAQKYEIQESIKDFLEVHVRVSKEGKRKKEGVEPEGPTQERVRRK